MADVIELIENDHREVEGLFSKFESTQDALVATKTATSSIVTRPQRRRPSIQSSPPTSRVARGWPRKVKTSTKKRVELIGRIRQTSDADHLAELVGELKQAIEHHVHEEESEILPKTREALESDRLEQLGQEFESAKG